MGACESACCYELARCDQGVRFRSFSCGSIDGKKLHSCRVTKLVTGNRLRRKLFYTGCPVEPGMTSVQRDGGNGPPY